MRNQRFELMCTFGTSLAAASRLSEDAPMLIFILLGHAPLVLVLTLVVALYLTVVELREFRPHYVWWFWWLLLVVMTHFAGYLLLRGYTLVRRLHART